MTERQRKFCDSYIICGNATQAAKEAGYSPKTAYSSGQRLLKNAEINDFLKSYWKSEAKSLVASVEEIALFWTATMTDENEKITARLKASEDLARLRGVFPAAFASTDGETDSESTSVIIYLPQQDVLPDEEAEEDAVDAAEDQPASPRLISE